MGMLLASERARKEDRSVSASIRRNVRRALLIVRWGNASESVSHLMSYIIVVSEADARRPE